MSQPALRMDIEKWEQIDGSGHRKLEPETCMVDRSRLYRMPWSNEDNAMTWLEITRDCDLRCDYCCQDHDPDSAKSLDTIERELDDLLALRRCNTVIIGGGEPLTHPDIVGVTKIVASRKVKPVVLTNGHALDRNTIHDLKQAGLFGFTFHVDSRQHRPGWNDASEDELNNLRSRFANMVSDAGGLYCSFNMVVFPETLGQVPDVARWTHENADRVQVMMFIAGRTLTGNDPWDYYANGKKINLSQSAYATNSYETNLKSEHLLKKVRDAIPGYKLNSYLGGTAQEDSIKWGFGIHLCSKEKTYGNLGKRSMGFLQRVRHWFTGRYFSNISPRFNKLGLLAMIFGLFDVEVLKAGMRYLKSVIFNPKLLFKKVYLQSIVVMQPLDFMDSGKQNHCEGCPNMTVSNGKLVNACHMESILKFGEQFTTIPKGEMRPTPLISYGPPSSAKPEVMNHDNSTAFRLASDRNEQLNHQNH